MAPNGFYAYPSQSDHLSETVEASIRAINKRNVVHIRSWRDIKIGGKIVIQTILNYIKNAELFLCDVTGLNPNVLFELGYAIGLGKRVWLSLDTTKAKSADQVTSFAILSELGYRAYTNHDAITTQFLRVCPYDDLNASVLSAHESFIERKQETPTTSDVFYIPSSVESTAVKRLVTYFRSLKEHNRRRVVVDDQLENSYEPLLWYLTNILDADAVVAHLDDEESPGALINNARCSLLAGMAHGLHRRLLMIAPSPFDPPFDYRKLLFVYNNARHCKGAVERWLTPILMTRVQTTPIVHDSELELLRFHIGETTAENEELELKDYFVPTAAYSAGIKNKMAIFVGRKGTGKTANLYQLREHFSNEQQNLVVTIKPVAFRIAAFGRLIAEFFPRPEEADEFIERTWRAIIYAEIAIPVCRRIDEDTRYRERTDDEETVVSHVERHREFVEADFAARIDMIRELVEKAVTGGASPKIALHKIAVEFSQPLVDAYSAMFRRFQSIVILVDNLDKAWSVSETDGKMEMSRGQSTPLRSANTVQTRLILGLLDFQNTIRDDLALTEGDVRVLCFLREDIFAHVVKLASEPDKVRLESSPVTWPDGSQLIRILEKRFLACSPTLSVQAIWDDLFCRKTSGVDTRQYLLRHTMPRPRDLIHVVRTAINNSVGRSHSQIEADDLKDALKEYYQFLLDNLCAEYSVYMPTMRNLIQAFSGSPVRQTRRQIWWTVRDHLHASDGLESVVEFLVRVSFLGIERQGSVEFVYTNDAAELLVPVLRRRLRWYYFRGTGFVIHPAFHAGLGLDEAC